MKRKRKCKGEEKKNGMIFKKKIYIYIINGTILCIKALLHSLASNGIIIRPTVDSQAEFVFSCFVWELSGSQTTTVHISLDCICT